MEPHRNLLIALSLSVIALSAVTIFQSTNKENVLGTTTTPVAKTIPCATIQSFIDSHCGQFADPNYQPEEMPASDDSITTTVGFCNDLKQLIAPHCKTTGQTTTPGNKPKVCINGKGCPDGQYCQTSKTSGNYSIGKCVVGDDPKISATPTKRGTPKVCSSDKTCLPGEYCKISKTAGTAKIGVCTVGTSPSTTTKPTQAKACTSDSKCAAQEYCDLTNARTVGTYKIGKCAPKPDDVIPTEIPADYNEPGYGGEQ